MTQTNRKNSVQILSNSEHLKKLELNALLELTTAISQNVSKSDLFKIFKFTLKANHLIKKVALFVKENNKWECACHFGVSLELSKINNDLFEQMPRVLHEPRGMYQDLFNDFDVVLPVLHKESILAYVFVDGDETFGVELRNERFDFIQTISNVLLYAVENKRLFSKQLEQQALKKEMEIASKVQAQLIPKTFPDIDKVSFFSTYIPHNTVGGDYYDLIMEGDDVFYVCIADVSGKGVPAAIFMSNFQASLRILLSINSNLVETVKKLNKHLIINTRGDHFITFFLAKIDIAKKQIEYINAGHNAPLLYEKQSDSFINLENGCTFLGAFDELPKIVSTTLPFGDCTLVLYTDGLTETFNENYEEFSLAQVEEVVRNNNSQSLEVLHSEMIYELDKHKGLKPYSDDITMFTISLNIA